jgi:DNA-binding LacI/PurR family transcriptional regulator
VISHAQEHKRVCPRLVGFDDAPVAEELNLTTIAIPWDEVIGGAVEIIKRRLNGDTSAARQLIVTPRPVVRKL